MKNVISHCNFALKCNPDMFSWDSPRTADEMRVGGVLGSETREQSSSVDVISVLTYQKHICWSKSVSASNRIYMGQQAKKPLSACTKQASPGPLSTWDPPSHSHSIFLHLSFSPSLCSLTENIIRLPPASLRATLARGVKADPARAKSSLSLLSGLSRI